MRWRSQNARYNLRIVVNTKQFKEHGPELVRLNSFVAHLETATDRGCVAAISRSTCQMPDA